MAQRRFESGESGSRAYGLNQTRRVTTHSSQEGRVTGIHVAAAQQTQRLSDSWLHDICMVSLPCPQSTLQTFPKCPLIQGLELFLWCQCHMRYRRQRHRCQKNTVLETHDHFPPQRQGTSCHPGYATSLPSAMLFSPMLFGLEFSGNFIFHIGQRPGKKNRVREGEDCFKYSVTFRLLPEALKEKPLQM